MQLRVECVFPTRQQSARGLGLHVLVHPVLVTMAGML